MGDTQTGFVGDWNGALANELKNEFNLVPGADRVNPGGLLVDAANGAALDSALVRRHLELNIPVGLITPNRVSLHQVQALAGHGPQGPLHFLALRRRDDGAYHMIEISPTKSVTGGGAGDCGHPVAAGATKTQGARQPEIGSVGTSHIASAFATLLGGATVTGLQSPLGTYGGYVRAAKSWTYELGYPAFNDKPDDRAAQTRDQSVSGSLNTDIYAFWVNGAVNTAYYVLIVRNSGTLSNGLLLANGDHNQGFFHYNNVVLSSLYVEGINQKLTASTHSPTTSGAGPIVTSLQVPMTLWGSVPGGVGPIDFRAEYASVANSPSWSLIDKSGSDSVMWQAYQSAVWDTLRYPPDEYTDAYRDILFHDGKVIPMPDQSKGSITFDTIAAYVIEAPAFVMPSEPQSSAPPSCPVVINTEVDRGFTLFHSPDGCLGALGSHRYNVFWRSGGGHPPSYRVDLQKVARKVG